MSYPPKSSYNHYNAPQYPTSATDYPPRYQEEDKRYEKRSNSPYRYNQSNNVQHHHSSPTTHHHHDRHYSPARDHEPYQKEFISEDDKAMLKEAADAKVSHFTLYMILQLILYTKNSSNECFS
jgi:hypothetical protein